jgi:hypothetical protein
MTLILAMSKADGFYISTDYRVTNARTGGLIDDASVKFLTVHYPPDLGGPRAVFAYTGLARSPDGTSMGRWIRETLRGETEVFDESMKHLRERLDRDFAHLKIPLMTNVFVTHGERRYVGGFSNFSWTQGVGPSFGYLMNEITQPMVVGNGSGARVVAEKHLALLHSQLNVTPRKSFDHMKLLATVNRRVAAEDSSVSPFCHVTFVSGDPSAPPSTNVFTERGESVPFEMPILLFGIDISVIAGRSMADFETMRRGEDPDAWESDSVNDELKRRP